MNSNIIRNILSVLAVCLVVVACEKEDKYKEKRANGKVNVPQTVSYDVAVDMGLSVKWAKHNLGASSQLDAGNYYAWGEILPKDTFNLGTYEHYDSTYLFVGSELTGTEHDAARMDWGGLWRMPTISEWKELADSCTWTWHWDFTQFGYEVIAKNGNSIFLPAAGAYYIKEHPTTRYDYQAKGYYWSSTFFYVGLGCRMFFNSNKPDPSSGELGYVGMPIRPVVDAVVP